jgi:hypothetical protein
MKKILFLMVLFGVALYMDNAVLGVLSFVVLVAYSIALVISNVRKAAQKPKTSVSVPVEVSTGPDYFCKIAGVQYRNDAQDIGGFLGYVRSEPDNPHDKNAIAIYRNDNKLVGYIPKDEIKNFREWSAKENLPCIGFIKDGDEVPLYGKVKIIDSDKDETELEIVKFVKWLVSNFGVKFIPAGFNVDTDKTLRTKKDWLAFLTEYIDEKENELYEE